MTCPDLEARKAYCVVGEYTDDGGDETTPSVPSTTTEGETTPSVPSTTTPETMTDPPTTIITSITSGTTSAPDPSNSPAMPGIVDYCDDF